MRTLLLALAASAAATAAQADTVLITAGRMLDVRTGRYAPNPQVLVRDGVIVSTNAAGAAADRRIDLPGMTLLPGLIDMHVHLSSTPLVRGYRSFEYTDQFSTVLAVPHAQATLNAGFTTVRNVGADDYSDVAMKQAVDGGFVTGPRVVPAGYSIGSTGGHCDSNLLPPSYARRDPGVADTAEQGRIRVREMRKFGAQVIKICATGGVFSRNTEPGAQQMTLDQMKAIVEEAHMLGMKVAAHAHGAEGIKEAIRAGVDTVEHVSFIDDEGIRLAKAAGTWLSMDIYNTEYTLAEGTKNGVLPESIEKERQVGTAQRENFRKAHRAGARMVFGSDAGVYPHGLNGRQFAVMVRFGMTPLQAIQAATVNAAEALGRPGAAVGELAPGKHADLIAVAGDPLSDVRLLEQIPVVIKGGAVVKDAR